MSLASGTSIGAYEIVTSLGAGGMGEVYRARDTRLGRDVALKVLPGFRRDDLESRARFDREARTLAALNDPRISAIHDVIDVGDHRAIVMELVEGPTLAQVLGSGPVPLRTALGYAIDICDALAVAHAVGVVHRDLKPANIVVTPSGSIKVLDFGIAKLGAGHASAALEASTMDALTGVRAIVGTPGYLSPEQAHGRVVDGRSDIFNLGIVLHEMISGSRAFQGESTAGLLSAVVSQDPPLLRRLVPPTPRSVERLVARCLEKDPQRRYQSAADVRAALEDIREDLIPPSPAAPPGGEAGVAFLNGSRARRLLTYVLGGTVIAAGGFVLARSSSAPIILTPSYRPFITEGQVVAVPVWSPDGRTLAYLGGSGSALHVFLRGVDATESTQVTRQAADGISLFWSPDATRIYFTRASDGGLVSVSAGGGEPQLVVEAEARDATSSAVRLPGGLKACMSPDGRTIVFPRGDAEGVRLWTMDVGTRATRVLDPAGMPKAVANIQALAFSPNGASLAVIASTTALNDARGVWLIAWPAGAARHVFADASYFAENPSISWLPDSRRFVMNGYPIHGGSNRLLLADARVGTLSPLTSGQDDEGSPSITSDGSRIAFVSRRSGLDLIRFRIDGGPPEPVLATSRTESMPDISPSGLLAYVSEAGGAPRVYVRSVINSWPRMIGDGRESDRATRPGAVRVSPDDQRLAVEDYVAEHLIWIYPIPGGPPIRLDSETTDQHGPSWSPDGNWIAYRRLSKGKWELVKAPVGGGPVQHLEEAQPGGARTDWSPTGQWIAHWRADGMHLVSPDGRATRVLAGLRSGYFHFSHDGSRLVAVRRGETRQWELTIWDIAAGHELRVVALPLPSTAEVQGMALAPDDSYIVLGAGTPTSDIWLLEQFEARSAPWAPWLRR